MNPHLALTGLLVFAAASLPVAAVAAGQQQPQAASQSDQATATHKSVDTTIPTNARPGGSTSALTLADLLEKLASSSASSDEIVAALREEARRNPHTAPVYEAFLAGEPGTSFRAGRTVDGKPMVFKISANGALLGAVSVA